MALDLNKYISSSQKNLPEIKFGHLVRQYSNATAKQTILRDTKINVFK